VCRAHSGVRRDRAPQSAAGGNLGSADRTPDGFGAGGTARARRVDALVTDNHDRPRVLLVEDDAASAAMLVEAVIRAGFDTRVASTGLEAIALFERWRPDLAVIDNGLPDTSGVEVAAALRSRGDTPFVFLSASTDESIAAQATALGAEVYLVKPFDASALALLLRAVLERADERRNLRGEPRLATAVAARDAAERERRLLAAELHDGIGQELAAASMLAEAIARRWMRDRIVKTAELEQLQAALHDAQSQCRRLSHEKFHGAIDGPELGRALRRLVRAETALGLLQCSYSGPSLVPPSVTAATSHHLLRIAQEAVRNAVKHSGGSRVVVRVRVRADEVELTIRDDGRGRNASDNATGRGIGFQTMHLRAVTIGGTLQIRNIPEGGSEVKVTVPLLAVKDDALG